MNFKILELLKQIELDDITLLNMIRMAYLFYCNNSSFSKYDEIDTLEKKKVFSILVRFFKCFTINKIISEENICYNLKEVTHGKKESFVALVEKINQIFIIQKSKTYFSSSMNKLSHFSLPKDEGSKNNTLRIKNLNFKINVIISNNGSNRLLQPEIYLYITLNNGKTKALLIDVKVFQELRKNLAVHIKKILDNESVGLLNNQNSVKDKLIN